MHWLKNKERGKHSEATLEELQAKAAGADRTRNREALGCWFHKFYPTPDLTYHIVLVKKKSGKIRCCIEFCDLKSLSFLSNWWVFLAEHKLVGRCHYWSFNFSFMDGFIIMLGQYFDPIFRKAILEVWKLCVYMSFKTDLFLIFFKLYPMVLLNHQYNLVSECLTSFECRQGAVRVSQRCCLVIIWMFSGVVWVLFDFFFFYKANLKSW